MAYLEVDTKTGSLAHFLGQWLRKAQLRGCTEEILRRQTLIYLCIYTLILAVAPLFAFAGFEISLPQIVALLAVVAFSQAIAVYYMKRHSDPFVSNIIAGTTQLAVISIICILYSYVAMRFNFPLVDEQLHQADVFLGFDWHGYKDVLLQSNESTFFALLCYALLDLQVVSACICAVLFLKFREYQIFVLAFMISALVVLFISIFTPAYATFHYYGVVEEMAKRLALNSGYVHIAQLDAIRAGLPFAPAEHMSGIIAFPSFHACGGLLFAWMFWQIPYFRVVMVPLNICMIMVTPIVGGHYFVDVIAGVLVGLAVITATHYAVMKNVKRQ